CLTLGERGLRLRRRGEIVGDVVDLAAEGIDRIHAVAPVARQQPHRPIERGPGRFDPLANGLAQRSVVGDLPDAIPYRSGHRLRARIPVRNAAAKSFLPSFTRIASPSPRRGRTASRAANATMTADSQQKPRPSTRGGRSPAAAVSPS